MKKRILLGAFLLAGTVFGFAKKSIPNVSQIRIEKTQLNNSTETYRFDNKEEAEKILKFCVMVRTYLSYESFTDMMGVEHLQVYYNMETIVYLC